MSVEFKDYYAVLGVPRDATDDQIKQAFRKLARKYHPDVAKDKKSAEEKFKEINEAHEVLSDPAKRKKYDELGADWQAGYPTGGPRGGPYRSRGFAKSNGQEFHFGGTGFSDFFEQFFGGSGFAENGPASFAETDSAHGPRRGSDVEGDILVTLREVMQGTTRPITLQTTDPTTGRTEAHQFTVRIPPGAPEGRRIRISGKGTPGVEGGGAGDLYLRVRYAAHPDFRTRDGDLFYDVPLAPWEAVLGTELVVPTLEGSIKLRVPSGTNHGKQLRVRGHGLPLGRSGARGDFYAVVNIRLPVHLSAAERKAWEHLGAISDFNPRHPTPDESSNNSS
jgi:curved DNA-binding protein